MAHIRYLVRNFVTLILNQKFKVRGSRSKAQHDAAVINCQFSMAVFSTTERKKRPRGDRKSTELSMHLQQALEAVIKSELYPWSQIDVFVEVLHADGGKYYLSYFYNWKFFSMSVSYSEQYSSYKDINYIEVMMF